MHLWTNISIVFIMNFYKRVKRLKCFCSDAIFIHANFVSKDWLHMSPASPPHPLREERCCSYATYRICEKDLETVTDVFIHTPSLLYLILYTCLSQTKVFKVCFFLSFFVELES